MKKLICLFLSLMTLVVLCCPQVAASPMRESHSLYVVSNSCPSEVITEIQNQAAELVLSMEETNELPHNVYLGHPFSYVDSGSDMFLFPVFIDNRITYVIRTTPSEDGIFGTISDFLASDLNTLLEAETTSEYSPARFYIDGMTLKMAISSNDQNIYQFGAEEFADADISNIAPRASTTNSNKKVENIAAPLEIFSNSDRQIRASTYPSSYYLHLDNDSPVEDQDDDSWCLAYCTAIIGRYYGAPTTAEMVMRYFYGSNPSSSQSLADYQSVEYAHDVLNLSRVTASASCLSTDTLKSQIGNQAAPVILCMYRPVTNGFHATVLRGYNSSKWIIWNPWYRSYESFSIGGSYTARNGVVYQYGGVSNKGRTIYNWTE